MNVEPISLEGKWVRVDPLRVDHIPAMCEVGLAPKLWQWTSILIEDPSDMERYVRDALADRDRGTAIPFVITEKSSGKVVGSTRFGNINTADRKVEIGWTWIAPAWQRTAINTETKLLLLTHAFEVWKVIRVEFKTDENNVISQNAIERLGAAREGTQRNHMITASGRIRNSVFFSIIDSEWESVKSKIGLMLQNEN
jgi:N-acetyltransferase